MSTNETMEGQISEKGHFVLVHGFCHGAWCWYKVVTILRQAGHTVTAVDLGGCGVHPKQLHQISSVSDYAQPLMDVMANLPEDEKVVLVGHSYGGMPVALAMESFPDKISVAVFVTSYMPTCEEPPAALIQEFFKRSSPEALMDCELAFDPGLGNLPISAVFGPGYMATRIYERCSLEDLELAKMLIRPNLFFLEDLSKKSLLSHGRYGRTKRCYVVCEDDQVMNEEFQRYMIEKNPPDEVVNIRDAGHMVILSKPQELCSCLRKLAQN